MPLAGENGKEINLENINLPEHHDFYKLLSLQSYITILISGIFLSMPIKALSLFSWSTFLSKPFVQYINIIFRMLPGIIVHLIILIGTLLPYIIINYSFYRTKMSDYQFFYSSLLQFLNVFEDISDIKLMDESSNGYSIKYSISQSEYCLLFNIAEKLIFIYSYACLISYCVNAVEKAVQYESRKEDDEVLEKMEDIEKLLEKEEEDNDDNLSNLKKQILWINFENNSDLYNKILNKLKNILLFKNTNPVISFLKYLFALKPLMQFKNLKTKLCIVIQYSSLNTRSKHKKEKMLDNIHALLEWLNFVGCKIPVIIYLEGDFVSLQKIQVSTSYKLIHFTDNLKIIENFINDESDDFDVKNSNEFQISRVSKFTLFRINYILVKDNIKSNNYNLNKKKGNKDENKYLSEEDDYNSSELHLSSDEDEKDEDNNNQDTKNEEKIKNKENKEDKEGKGDNIDSSSYFSKHSFSDSSSSKSN